MYYLFIGKTQTQVSGFNRVNITNQVGNAYIGRGQFFA
jgi:hypothetical protein